MERIALASLFHLTSRKMDTVSGSSHMGVSSRPLVCACTGVSVRKCVGAFARLHLCLGEEKGERAVVRARLSAENQGWTRGLKGKREHGGDDAGEEKEPGPGSSVSPGGRQDYRCTHNVLQRRPRAE